MSIRKCIWLLRYTLCYFRFLEFLFMLVLLSLDFCFSLSFCYHCSLLLTGYLASGFCCCSDHSEYLPTAHSADPRDATSPVLSPHTFFISHISPNLTLHTISFCCQLTIVLMLEYKTSSFWHASTTTDICTVGSENLKNTDDINMHDFSSYVPSIFNDFQNATCRSHRSSVSTISFCYALGRRVQVCVPWSSRLIPKIGSTAWTVRFHAM